MYATGYQVEAWEECLQSEGQIQMKTQTEKSSNVVQVEMCEGDS